MDAVLPLIIMLVALLGWIVYARFRRDLSSLDSLDVEYSFNGIAVFVSSPFTLPSGDYKLRYTFPEATLVKIDLIAADGSDSETLVLKSGVGETRFTVVSPGRYRCQVAPMADAPWKFEMWRLRTLGLSDQ